MISPFFFVIFPNPCAFSSSKNPSIKVCSVNITFRYPESFLKPFLISETPDSKFYVRIFYLFEINEVFESLRKDFSLSDLRFDFRCLIIDFPLDSGRTKSVLFVSLLEDTFLMHKKDYWKDSSLIGRSGDVINAFCFLAFSKTPVIN